MSSVAEEQGDGLQNNNGSCVEKSRIHTPANMEKKRIKMSCLLQKSRYWSAGSTCHDMRQVLDPSAEPRRQAAGVE